MPTHLYCLIGEADAPSPSELGLRGRGDVPVRSLPLSAIAMVAWVSTVMDERIPRELASLRTVVLEHDRVAQAAVHHAGTVVPALLADPYADDQACRMSLLARSTEIETLRRRADDIVEMTLLITTTRTAGGPAADPPAGSRDAAAGAGQRYLSALRDRRETADRRVAALVAALTASAAPLASDTRRRDDRDRIVLSHALHRDAVDAYRSAAEAVPVPEELRLTIDGPRAPYTFASLPAPARHDSGELSDLRGDRGTE